MKINKKNLFHWIFLASYAIQATVGILIRKITNKTSIVLYGHKLNGNLLAIYKACPEAIFLSMDRRYCQELKRQGIRCQWACSFGAARLLASAIAIISDHGLHSLELLLPAYRKQGLKCFDVWHGIPFKGFDSQDFRLQQQYDETWVASELHRNLYIQRYGFTPQQTVITGYARTDALIHPRQSNAEIRAHLELPAQGKLILFAPTWAQDNRERTLFPFAYEAEEFLGALSAMAQKHQANVLLRTHLNSSKIERDFPGIISLPSSQWPDTESILQISDMLICDWSSIAFDYLLLDRPTFFLDVPAPFQKGFSLGPDYRFGPVIGCLPQLLGSLENTLQAEDGYWQEHADKHQRIRATIYGTWADGHATKRCLERLRSNTALIDGSFR
nr:CDP-glycerol glycerophosphotransferase family protein [Pseudomonas sp. s4]